MAKFDIAYGKTLTHEGGYVPARVAASIKDPGGETYMGIARNYHPNWPGWKLIDAYNNKNGIAKHNFFFPIPELKPLHKAHIKKNFWDVNKLSDFKNQSVANYLFDIGYGSGPGIAAMSIQDVLGLRQDGVIGPVTIAKANSTNQKDLFEKLKEYREDWLRENVGGKSYLPVLIKRNNSFFFQEEAQ
jgi:lysozyme family protein